MSQHLDHSEIAFGPIIGSGGDGIVHKATWRGLEVAVKLISSGPAAVESFCKEIEVHKEMVHHPNIVHFIGYCLVPRCLIFEVCGLDLCVVLKFCSTLKEGALISTLVLLI